MLHAMKINLRLLPLSVLAVISLARVGQASTIPGLEGQTDERSNAVDTYVRAEMKKQHIPGLALLVSRAG
jgi:hypothetical protein